VSEFVLWVCLIDISILRWGYIWEGGQTNKSENNGWGQTNDIVAETDKVINLIE
jgi:hypothetical protein